jgi:hypothetical protein
MQRKAWISSIGLAVVLLVTSCASSAMAQGKTVTRPISDWIAAQGSKTAADWAAELGFGFIANYVAWSGRTGPHEDVSLLMVVDYAGLDAEAVAAESDGAITVPTKITGSVIERPLSDGRTEVHVTLRTRNALTYVVDFELPDTFGPTIFGATPSEVAAGAKPPGLGDSLLEVVYIVDRVPGGPMEDLVHVIFQTADWLFVKFIAAASGEFRGASGFPEGTAGRASTQQTGLLGPAVHNGFRGALGDAFPAEWINLHVTGR